MHLNHEARWIEVAADRRVREVEEALRAKGLYLGSQPPSVLRGTVGAWLTGPFAGRWVEDGRLSSAVAGLRVVLPTGIVTALRPAPRSAAGPGLAQLFLGSGGEWGTILGATLRARPLPSLLAQLSLRGGADALSRWLLTQVRRGAPPLVLRASEGDGLEVELSLDASTASGRIGVDTAMHAAAALGIKASLAGWIERNGAPSHSAAPLEASGGEERELDAAHWAQALSQLHPGEQLFLVRIASHSAVVVGAPQVVERSGPWPEPGAGTEELDRRLTSALRPSS
jgi:alkyldihydroxyacetonephosphate synthase